MHREKLITDVFKGQSHSFDMSRALIEKMFTRVGDPMYISGHFTLKIKIDPSLERIFHRLPEIKINLRAILYTYPRNE